eukprot:Nk52_evm21s158 gene=Nk52_evmTU21s158
MKVIGQTSSLAASLPVFRFVILFFIFLMGFCLRLFAVLRFESIIHEFDPWFNYRGSAYFVEHGFYDFLNWFDELAWYPLGRIVGGTVYPGLMVTSALFYHFLDAIHMHVHIREICVFLAPVFSGFTAIATYLLTAELKNKSAGLFAAAFIAIAPGYISRSVAGSYDNEGIAIFALMFTYWLWLKSVKSGSIFYGGMTALSYFYMVSAWGGYVFIMNLIPLHVFVLILMGRYNPRLYSSFTTFYILGTILSMQIPFVGFAPIRTSEHMAALGVFCLLQLVAFSNNVQSLVSESQFKLLMKLSIAIVAGIGFLGLIVATRLGYVAPWTGRFYSLYDTGYAKIHIPIIASVSEHQPPTWNNFFFDLQVLVALFPAGLCLMFFNMTDVNVFITLYAVTSVYFAGVMIRLVLTLTPVVCVLAAVALNTILDTFLTGAHFFDDVPTVADESSSKDSKKSNNKQPRSRKLREMVVLPKEFAFMVMIGIFVILSLFTLHCTWVTSNAYSSPTIVLSTYNRDGSRYLIDDFREAYYWLRRNTDEKARIMSWWDYGYQITGMSNRTVLVDNNTWNNSHIALVGKAMSSNETVAYKIMQELDVDYVLVVFGGFLGYSGDDINKFLWMIRIAQGEHPNDVQESKFFNNGNYRVDSGATQTMKDSLMYQMCYYRFGELRLDMQHPPGFDRVRNAEIGHKNIKLKHIEEAFTTEHWMVRIYRVKPLPNRDEPEATEKRRNSGLQSIPRVSKTKTSVKKAGKIATA